jgi:hypothetical protein
VVYFRLYNDCAVGLDDPGFESWLGQHIFLVSKTPALGLRLTEPPVQWILSTTSVELKWPEVGS